MILRTTSSLIIGLILLLPASVHALDPPTVLISEIQTGSSASANDEFIELYNAGPDAIDLSTWKVEYYPSSALLFGSPFRTISLTGTISPDSYYLIASTDYLIDSADLTFSKVLASTGGHLRLVHTPLQGSPEQIDLIAWGTATLAEGTKAPAAGDGKSLSRKATVDSIQDTDNNNADFEVLTTPTPTSGLAIPDPELPDPEPVEEPPAEEPEVIEPPVSPPEEPVVPPVEPPIEIPAPTTTAILPVQITELMPNPASPATDDSDEFVELYNPNDQSVDLSGYILKTGANLTYQHDMSGLNIGPKSYITLFSRDTELVLSNTSGRAVLFDPSGASISSSESYSDAPEGQSWQIVNNVWQWSTAPTPNTVNIVAVPKIKVVNSSKPLSKKATKKTTKAKVASAKTTKAKKASSAKAKAKNLASQPASIIQGQPLHPAVLGTMASLALLYGAYEYRSDIQNSLRKLRRNRSSR